MLSPLRYIYQTQLENLTEISDSYQPKNMKFSTYAKLINVTDEEIAEIKPDYIILAKFHRCGADVRGMSVDKLFRVLSRCACASLLGKQRVAKENGKLTAEQVKRLESIGMIWDKTEYNWLQCFNALKSYFALHSTTQLPYRYINENGLQLFEWLTRQKRRYMQGKLPMRQTQQLRSIGVEL